MKTYIAGPMSGYKDLNFPAFHAAAALYRSRGCEVVNPAELNNEADALAGTHTPEQAAAHWVACMRKDLTALLTCDHVVMLGGWEKSKGASLERHVAKALGLTVSYLGAS